MVHPMREARKAIEFLAAIPRACAAHRVSIPGAYARALSMYAFGDYSRKEILGYGLFVPAIREAMPVLISKERSLAKLAAFNPPALQHLTEDKDEFHRVCARNGLPVPATFGWTRDGIAYDTDGARLDTTGAWARHLAARLPAEFIVKDRAGAYGSGFRAFRRKGERFVAAEDGRSFDAPALAELLSGPSGGDLIVQERLYDHPSLAELSGRRGLQTARINTLLGADGEVELLFFMFKVLAGHTLSDNFSMGTSGNLIAFGDLDQGVLRGAVTRHACGSGMARVERHPHTGVAFDGFRLPWWPEALALVQRAQRCFPGLPTLGWDVALTEAGPVIVEANARWDPPAYAPFIMSAERWRRIFG
jgi:hypothetical protein